MKDNFGSAQRGQIIGRWLIRSIVQSCMSMESKQKVVKAEEKEGMNVFWLIAYYVPEPTYSYSWSALNIPIR